jgi:hypothetical protein
VDPAEAEKLAADLLREGVVIGGGGASPTWSLTAVPNPTIEAGRTLARIIEGIRRGELVEGLPRRPVRRRAR